MCGACSDGGINQTLLFLIPTLDASLVLFNGLLLMKEVCTISHALGMTEMFLLVVYHSEHANEERRGKGWMKGSGFFCHTEDSEPSMDRS